ncbi:hypothetical protein ZOSMA_293G00030 [Zostera marina]|uniref:Uncharacterized protein n=1 Tax=Zostera marina TaxID=29655 RepID=A0A0K9PEA8_ZOSMR|nr:hypothetical protein ZOSMA_293G00030 [Zostera marina]
MDEKIRRATVERLTGVTQDIAGFKKGNDCEMFRELNEICYVDGYQHLVHFAENSMKLLCEMKGLMIQRF